MTSQQQRLEELRQRAKGLAEQIEQLEEQINSARPTSGLLGRWATNRDGKQVLITTDRPVDGWIETTYVNPDGTTREKAEQLDSLSFPDQATRPQDVPVGEAWLVNAADEDHRLDNIAALKVYEDMWETGGRDGGLSMEWDDNEVELITPLIPARPQDTPETVTTEEEYEALPEGSIVAEPGRQTWTRLLHMWAQGGYTKNDYGLSGITRHVLRRGWGE